MRTIRFLRATNEAGRRGHRGIPLRRRTTREEPAVIVQNDRDNTRLANTVVAMISGNLRHADEPTQLLVDPATPDGNSSGLHGPSVVKCCNLFTVAQADVRHVIGQFSEAMMAKLEECLKIALELN